MAIHLPPEYRVAPTPYAAVHGWTNQNPNPLAETYPLVSLAVALGTTYMTDAHILPYAPDDLSISAIPRVMVNALGYLQSVGHEPKMTAMFVDIDRVPHEPWASEDEAKMAVAQLALLGGHFDEAGVYATSRGLRVVWALPERIPVSAWRPWADAFLDEVLAPLFGPSGIFDGSFTLDRTCTEWWRSFRAPTVVRDGVVYKAPKILAPIESGRRLTWSGGPSTASVPAAMLTRSKIVFNHAAPDDTPHIPQEMWDALKRPVNLRLDALQKGEVLAAEGERTNTLKATLSMIATGLKDITHNPVVYLAIVRDSVLADTSDGAPTLDEAWNMACYFAALEGDQALQGGARPQFGDELVEFIPAIEPPDAPPTAHLTTETVRPRPRLVVDIPEDGTLPEAESSEPLFENQPAIVLHDPSYFVYDGNLRRYIGPFSSQGLYPVLRDRRPDVAITNAKGAIVATTKLLLRYGAAVRSVTQAAFGPTGYDPRNDSLIVQACIPKAIDPAFDPRVDEWLRLLGGESYDLLEKWLATIQRLDWPTPALYLEGPKSAGKGLLASLLASLWGEEHVPFKEAINQFNYRLTRCPVAFLDEGFSMSTGMSALFRSFVAERDHAIADKYVKTQTLKCYLRLIIAANNDRALSLEGVHSAEDADAITSRLFHIPVDDRPGAYLRKIGGRATTTQWIQDGRAAAHLRWIQAEKCSGVVPGSRFLIEPRKTRFHENLLVNSPGQHSVIMAIALAKQRAANNDFGVYSAPLEGDAPGIYVNVSKLQAIWKTILPTERDVPTTYDLTNILRTLSPWDMTKVARVGGSTKKASARVWWVDSALIYRVAAENGVWDLEGLAEALGLGVDFDQHTKGATP